MLIFINCSLMIPELSLNETPDFLKSDNPRFILRGFESTNNSRVTAQLLLEVLVTTCISLSEMGPRYEVKIPRPTGKKNQTTMSVLPGTPTLQAYNFENISLSKVWVVLLPVILANDPKKYCLF